MENSISTEPTKIFNSVQEVHDSYNTGDRKKDLELVNAVLKGEVGIKQPDPQPSSDVPSGQTNTGSEEIPLNPASSDIVSPQVLPTEEELEAQRRYNEFLENKQKEEHLKYLSELKAREDALQQERANREELERRLQELAQKQTQTTNSDNQSSSSDDEEEAFISDYAKKTRAMVEELRSQTGDNPVVKELMQKISSIQQEYEQRKLEETKVQQEKQRIEREQKLFDGIRQFQSKVPELQTGKDIKEIDQEYSKFRKDIGYLVGAKNSADVEIAIKNYYAGGQVKELAESKGIKAHPDYQKYEQIVNLIDKKNGVVFDAITGQEKPILDDEGNRVRYRSLEEVYKIEKYYEDLNNARRQTLKEVQSKLTNINQAPVTLSNEQTTAFSSGFSAEQEREILNWSPRVWEKDPEKRKMVETVYAKRGLEMPRYRGRK